MAHTWPLLRHLPARIVADPGDPVLNASILWWNARTVPFTRAWWDAPAFYPALGVSGFTENLVGLAPITSPVIWLTGNAIAAYNVAVFLTWPLSALAVYALVRRLTARHDAGFLAGLAFAFTPYRMMELSHLQMLASFWLPLCLLGLHAYLADGRRRWLAVVAVTWLLNALTNGHFLLFGSVFVGLWLVYFGSARATRARGLTAFGALALASLPLVPVLLTYQAIHDQYGLVRTEAEVLAFSATPHSWLEVSSDTWFWPRWVPEGRDNLFPGLTAIVLLVCGGVTAVRHGAVPAVSRRIRHGRAALATVGMVAALAIAAALLAGPWSVTVGGVLIRMRDLNRAILVLILCIALLAWLTPGTRAALARRSPLVFYTAMLPIVALLCCGPDLRANGEIILSPAPYRWLMALPGFTEIRVPLRFWMLGVLSLSIAAGLGFAHLARARARTARAAFAAAVVGLSLDGGIHTFRLAAPPERWPALESADRRVPLLELPIGGAWDQDWAATYRAAGHGRRLLNGVSGYNPPHYSALVTGLERRDPALLSAIAMLGPVEVLVNPAADPGGAIERYVATHPLASPFAFEGPRRTFTFPDAVPPADLGLTRTPAGPRLPIAGARTVRHDADASRLIDGRLATVWADAPQQFDQWLELDLGVVTDVATISQALGDFPLDFPRRLTVELSDDRSRWTTVWSGATAAHAFLALAERPREGWLSIAFPPRRARFVRLRQLDTAPVRWTVAEIAVYGATGVTTPTPTADGR